MTRIIRQSAALLAIGSLAALGGCKTTVNRGVESIKQPVVSRSDHVFDVALAGGRVTPEEARRLGEWFEAIGLRYGDRVGLDDPLVAAPGARADVAGVASRWGLLVADDAPPTAGEVQPGHVRVVVSRTVAEVPDCPDWSGGPYSDFTSSTTSNYGCASNRNLAVMVADPEDLVRGRVPGASVDARSATKAIGLYRERQPSGTAALPAAGVGGSN